MKAYNAFAAINNHSKHVRRTGVQRNFGRAPLIVPAGHSSSVGSGTVTAIPGAAVAVGKNQYGVPTLYVKTGKGYLPYTDALANPQAAGPLSAFGSWDDNWCVQAGAMWLRFNPGQQETADAMVRRCKTWPFAPNTDANRIVNSLPAGFSADEATARAASGWTDIVVNNDLAKKAADAAKAEAERLLNAEKESQRRAQAARDEAARQAETMRQAQIKAEQDRLRAQQTVPNTIPGTVGTRNANINVGIPQLAPPQMYVAPAKSNLPLILGGLGVAGVAAFLLLKK